MSHEVGPANSVNAPVTSTGARGDAGRRSLTLTRVVGRSFAALRDLVARALLALGVTPNQLTVVGLLLSAAAGVAFALGVWRFRLAAALVLAAGACDMLDGAVAKLAGGGTSFGAFLDSSADRYSDGFLFGGLIWYWAMMGARLLLGLSLSALVGSLVVSYTRARAENLIDSCKVGFWERGERTVLLILAAALGTVPAALLLLGTLTHLTALQRILYARQALDGRQPQAPEGKGLRIGWWFLHRIVLWRYPRASFPYDLAVVGVVAFILLFPLSAGT